MAELTVRDRCLAILSRYFDDFENEGAFIARAAADEVIFAPKGAIVRDVDKLDSLDRTEFVMAVEDEFKPLDIPDNIAEGFKTLADVVKYVETMKAVPAHGAH